MVADRKVWPDARTGAKGQRQTHSRAGAGLASPDGTEKGADTIVIAQGCRKLVLTLALTFYPLPQERKSRQHVFSFSADRPANPVTRVSKDAANVKALSLGRGLGEGGRKTIYPGARVVSTRSGGTRHDRIKFFGRWTGHALRIEDNPRSDEAKGQRPTHGRAGAGLASPAGTGARAAVIEMAQ